MKVLGIIAEYNPFHLGHAWQIEASKKERDQEKLSKLNTEMREAYSQIMSNENMIAYNDAKAAFDVVANRVLAIVQQSAEGADPETADYSQSSCSGSCATCGGCG